MKESNAVKTSFSGAYSSAKNRKSMKIAERHAIMQEYIKYSLNNHIDNGGRGKAFETHLRFELVPNTTVLKCQKQGMKDIAIKLNGKVINVEGKVGGGCLAENVYFGSNWKNELDLDEILNFDYIAYLLDYTGETAELYCDTVIMTKKAFIEWCESWKTGATGWLTYKTKENRLMIANPRATPERKEFASERLVSWAEGREGCYTLEEFKEMLGR